MEKLFIKIYNQLEKYKDIADDYARLNKAREYMMKIENLLIKKGDDKILKKIEEHEGDIV